MNKNKFSMVAALWLMGVSIVQSQNFSEWFRRITKIEKQKQRIKNQHNQHNQLKELYVQFIMLSRQHNSN